MLAEREWRGIWWDARHPEHSTAGVLTFSQENAELLLIGRLPQEGTDAEAFFRPTERPRICGLTTDGEELTLERCTPLGQSVGKGVPTERHRPQIIFEGAHFSSAEEISFDEALIRFTHLDAWAGMSGFQQSYEIEENAISRVKVNFAPPPTITATLNSGVTASVSFAWSWSGQAAVTTETRIAQRATFGLEFPTPTPYRDVLETAGRVRNFLHLGVGHPVHPREFVCVKRREAEGASGAANYGDDVRVSLYYSLSDPPEVNDLARTVLPHEMPFTLADIVHDLEENLDRWFAAAVRLKPVLNLYYGVAYGALRYLEPKFLSLAQALETYHRRTSSDTDLPPSEHDRWLAAVVDAAPLDTRDRLRLKLQHSNQLPLRKRLKSVIAVCPMVSERIVAHQSRFVEQVLTARNYYTHYDESLEQRAPQGLQLVPLTFQLRALVEMCLLTELGFGEGDIDAIFERTDRYRRIQHFVAAAAAP